MTFVGLSLQEDFYDYHIGPKALRQISIFTLKDKLYQEFTNKNYKPPVNQRTIIVVNIYTLAG